MKCASVRMGKECSFMAKEGCSFIGGSCKPVSEKCEGCKNVEQFDNVVYCISYMEPSTKWAENKVCPMCTVIVEKIKEEANKINPLKASKKAAKRKKK